MPRGQPDFGGAAPLDVMGSVADIGELAARLGSIVTYDRRGLVSDLDDFESPTLKWRKYPVIGGGLIYLSSESMRSGNQAVKIVTLATADIYCGLSRIVITPSTKRVGIEASYSYIDSGSYFNIGLDYYDGVTEHKGIARVDPDYGDLYILDSTDNFVKIATLGALHSTYFFNCPMKLVVSFETDYYVRLLFLDREYDLSSYKLYTDPQPVWYAITAFMYLQNKGVDAAKNVHVDDFVFTHSEP